jgi:hypothetical protein
MAPAIFTPMTNPTSLISIFSARSGPTVAELPAAPIDSSSSLTISLEVSPLVDCTRTVWRNTGSLNGVHLQLAKVPNFDFTC